MSISYRIFFVVALKAVSWAGASEASKVFEENEASVVRIFNEQGTGSGILITEDGLILTNYHVVNSPLPLTVEASAETNDLVTRQKFSGLSVHMIHKERDLALVKIVAPNSRFKPTQISRSPDDAKAGSNCYVLGFPHLPGQETPQLTITRGIISNPAAMVNGQKFLQLDAAINPGNSGGALIGENGILIGIPTMRYEGGENIGMATPVHDVQISQFGDLKFRVKDGAEAERLAGLARDLFDPELPLDSSRFGMIQTALQIQELAISHDPTNPALLRTISLMFLRLEEFELAKAYAESAVRMNPDDPGTTLMLASIFDASGDSASAAALRLKILARIETVSNLATQEGHLRQLIEQFNGSGDLFRAFYITSWAIASGLDLGALQKFTLESAQSRLPEALVRTILAKKSGYSVADMNAVGSSINQNPTLPPTPTDSTTPAVAVAGKSPDASPAPITEFVTFPPDAEVILADSTPGVVFDRSKGLRWTPPPYTRNPRAVALFVVKHRDGKEEFLVHRFPSQ